MRLITLISAGVFLVLSSFIMKNKHAKQDVSLYATTWSLKKMHTDNGIREVTTKAFLRFDELKQSAGGNGSCNSFGSSISIHGRNISFKNIFSTKMYCEEVQETENLYFSLLDKVNLFGIKDKTLFLYQDNNLLLEFIAQ